MVSQVIVSHVCHMFVELINESKKKKNRDTYKEQWRTKEDTANSVRGKGQVQEEDRGDTVERI